MACAPAAGGALTLPGPVAMDVVAAGGLEVAVERRGTGPPLLLVHGIGGPAMWERAVPVLADSFDVVLPHLPGFGESPPPPRPLGAEGYARTVEDALGAIGFGGAAGASALTVAGISYGGEIAARLAAGRPGFAGALVLVCPTGTRRYPAILGNAAVRRWIRPLLRRALTNPRIADRLSRRSFFDPSSRPADLVARHLEHLSRPGRVETMVDTVEGIWTAGNGLAEVVRGIGAPLTLVWGEEDRTVPPGSSAPLRAARPDARMVVIPGCGHSVPLERPAELAAAIVNAAGPRLRPRRP